jgi:hypothetical protein
MIVKFQTERLEACPNFEAQTEAGWQLVAAGTQLALAVQCRHLVSGNCLVLPGLHYLCEMCD